MSDVPDVDGLELEHFDAPDKAPPMRAAFDALTARARQDPSAYELARTVLPRSMCGRGRRKFPEIYLIDTPDGTLVGGRYFPHYAAIVVYAHNDPEITAATIVHELAHFATYKRRCGAHHWTAQCGYVGDHDRGFYSMLEAMHAAAGISPEAARVVEHKYRFPRHWHTIEAFSRSGAVA